MKRAWKIRVWETYSPIKNLVMFIKNHCPERELHLNDDPSLDCGDEACDVDCFRTPLEIIKLILKDVRSRINKHCKNARSRINEYCK